jgi:putative transposase
MINYVHLIAIPERENSLAVLLRRVHGRYAQYCNPRCGRSGSHLWAAIAYVERNPVRAGLMNRPGDCPWSSAAAHLTGADPSGVLDMLWWRHESPAAWAEATGAKDPISGTSLRRCTYSGRPFGDEEFVREVSRCFGRYWTRGRPPKQPGVRLFTGPGDQFSLFGEPCGKLLSSG